MNFLKFKSPETYRIWFSACLISEFLGAFCLAYFSSKISREVWLKWPILLMILSPLVMFLGRDIDKPISERSRNLVFNFLLCFSNLALGYTVGEWILQSVGSSIVDLKGSVD